MVPDPPKRPRVVRRVVSKLEGSVCESVALDAVYGHQTRGPATVAEMLRPLLEDEPVEVFVSLLLNGKHRVFALAEVSRGTLTTSLVHPREVFGPALRMSAAAVIVAHNHPSGDPDPSVEDLEVTRRLRDAGKLLGVPLLDHVILGEEGTYTSLRDRIEF